MMKETASPQSQSTWNEFIQALHAPAGEDFNPFYWIYRLTISLLHKIIPCRSHGRRQRIHRFLSSLRPLVPLVGMVLVLLCGWSYFSIFRYTVVRQKWCDDTTTCRWEMVHGSLVIFLIVNIIGHYLWCIFKSPGVVKAIQEIFDHTKNINNSIEQSSAIIYHPDPNPSYCNKCEITRPARAHHCKICKKCILRYDHHCPWVNNCIGRNNYRSFVLLVFYLTVGCTYGVLMLGVDFCDVMKRRIELYGWSIRGAEHGTGLLDLPLPWVLWRDYRDNGYIDQHVVLRAAFPLMFFVGIVMYWFLGYHMRIIISGLTTLEDMSRPKFATVNPFDDGARNNLKQVFGKSWFLLLIPLSLPRTSSSSGQIRYCDY